MVSNLLTWDNILVFINLVVMCLSAYQAQSLTKRLCSEESKTFWKIMVTLVQLFAVAYLILFFATVAGENYYISKLTNIVFLGGSVFVLLTVIVTSQMNKKIQNYIENLELQVYKRTQELKETQETIIEQQMNLAFASKMSAVGQMAGGIAHEINNPLTIILSLCILLKKSIEKGKFDPTTAIKSLDEIEKTITRISKIIQGLRTISRDTSDEEFISVKLRDLMEDVVGLCSEKFKNHGVNFIIDLNDPLYDQIIECRRVQVSQVMINLLGNAFDVVENLPHPWIKLECEKLDENTKIRVIDSGPGVPKEIQEKVFEPFFTTKPIGKGTGLGLSLSVSILKEHSGTLTIDNENLNTCFVVTLPNVRKVLTVD